MKKKGDKKLIAYTFRVHLDLLDGLKKRADQLRMPVSLVLRKLIEKFLKGDIDL